MAAGSMSSTVTKVVLDTSVVSLMFRGDSRAEYYKTQIAGLSPHVSF